MPNRKTIGSWSFNNLGYESNEFGEVTVIFYKTCREYYSTNAISSSSFLIKSQVDLFVSGTNVKKSNFSDHIKKSIAHFNAVKRLNQTLETPPDQTSIVTCVSDFGNTSGSNFYCYMCKWNEPKTERSIGDEISTCPFHSNTWKTF